MTIFEKGNYKTVPSEFRTFGIASLEELSKFQERFEIYDTDTTINAIRDAIIANYLDFDLLNFDKHGFDAKKSGTEHFLEVKQCSVSSSEWNGVWNDTTEEKAKAFSKDNVFVVVALWKTALSLKFMIYGQNKNLGVDLLKKVKNRKAESRSTQKVSVSQLITKYKFSVVCLEDIHKQDVYDTLIGRYKSLKKKLKKDDIKTLRDI